MRQLLLFFLILFCIGNFGFAQTYPLVVKNTSNPGGGNLLVKSSQNGGAILTSFSVGSTLVASNQNSGSSFTGSNGHVGNYWYRVDIPSATASTQGYCAAGSTFSNPECGVQYVVINEPSIFIRTAAGVGNPNVTISGSNARVWLNQRFSVLSSQNVGADIWYRISLTNNCSQITGWIAGFYAGVSYVSLNMVTSNGLPLPNLSYSNQTLSSVALNWLMTVQPSGNTNTNFAIYKKINNGSYNLLTNVATIANTYTDNTLSAGNTYYYKLKASYGNCITTSYSNEISFSTAGCTPPTVNNTTSPTAVVAGGTLNMSATASPVGSTFAWSGPNFNSVLQNPTKANMQPVLDEGNYCVTATYAGCTSTQDCKNITVSAAVGNITIDQFASIAPLWLRVGDAFSGNINVTTTPANSSWRLVVEVYDEYMNQLPDINYPYINGNSQNFFNTDPALNNVLIPNYKLKLYAQLNINQTKVLAKTIDVIEAKWDYENIIYHNDITSPALRIPIKYYSITSPTHAIIEREGNVSYSLGFPPTKKGDSYSFNLGANNKYCTLPYSGFLDILPPGDFKVTIFSGALPLESQYFDFTKYDKIYENPNSTNCIIAIGGIFNELENTANDLRFCMSIGYCNESGSFTVLDSLKNHFDIWYIAQGNANAIYRNGYDVGKAIEKIKILNPNSQEINLVCHSKGGLDTRAYLQSKTQSFRDFHNGLPFSNYGYGGSNIIKKVLFLGTPHAGAPIASVFYSISLIQNCPGAKDLGILSSSILNLNGLPNNMPTSIEYLNLAGYSIAGDPVNGDGVVPIKSNRIFTDLYKYTNNVKQLYQHSHFINLNGDLAHFRLHRKEYLKIDGNNYFNCFNNNYNTNLKKVVAFFNGVGFYNSCNNLIVGLLEITAFKSLVPNSSIFLKPLADTGFAFLGQTDQNSFCNIQLNYDLQLGDSIKIESTGCESITLPIDSNIIQTHKLGVPMFKSQGQVTKIKCPSVINLSQKSILNGNGVNLKVGGENVLNYEINSSFNQDTNFVPLILNGGQFTANLDTGRNMIAIRFIGAIDTVILYKNIYYMPDTFLSLYCNKVYFNTSPPFLGTKIYVNNEFQLEINSPSDSLYIHTGENLVTFKKFGYLDSAISIENDTVINIASNMFPISYSSLQDSSVFNFSANKVSYWKNISMLDSNYQNQLSIKQYDDNLTNLGVQPKCRKFEMNKIGPVASGMRFAAILDQVEDLSKDSIYLLRIIDDILFTKIHFDTTYNIAHYDSTVQKLDYSFVDFNNGLATKEALIILKKKAPVVNVIPIVNINQHDSVTVPLSYFFTDPDSIHNDLFYLVNNVNPLLNIFLIGDSIRIVPNTCMDGQASFVLSARHDSLWRNKNIDLNIIPSLPLFNVTANAINNPLCVGDSTALIGGGAVSYTWSNGITNNVLFSPNATNTYTVTGTNASGCTKTATISVVVNNLPNVIGSASANQICQGTVVSLTSTGATNYSWQPGNLNGASQNVTPNATTTYTVYGSDANGCSNTSTVHVIVDALPVIIFNNNNPVLCTGNSVNLTASGAQVYSWNPGNLNGANMVFSPLNNITYTVTGIDALGCSSTNSVTINVNQIPVLNYNASADSICYNSPVTINATGTSVIYNWMPGNVTGATQIFTPLLNTIYTVTGIDINGCSMTSAIPIVVNTLPLVGGNVSGNVICFGDTVIFNGNGANIYNWTGGVQNNLPFTPSVTSIYTVIGVDNNNCSNSSTVAVTVNQLPIVFANTTAAIICKYDSIILFGSGANIYSWSNAVSDSVKFEPTATNTYTVTGTDLNGCISISSVYVIVNPLPITVANASDTEVCASEAINLFGTGALSYTWSDNRTDGQQFFIYNSATYKVIGTDANNCTSNDSIFIKVNQLPEVSIIPGNDTLICAGSEYYLSSDKDFYSYQWKLNNVNSVTTKSIKIDLSGFYILNVTDTNTCHDIDTVFIDVKPIPVPKLSIENYKIYCSNVTGSTYQWYLNNTLLSGQKDSIIVVTEEGEYKVIVIDEFGCEGFESLTYSANNEISVYPNPTNGLLNIDYYLFAKTPMSIKLIDMAGRVVHTVLNGEEQLKGHQSVSIDLDKIGIATGIYILSISGNETKWSVRVMYN